MKNTNGRVCVLEPDYGYLQIIATTRFQVTCHRRNGKFPPSYFPFVSCLNRGSQYAGIKPKYPVKTSARGPPGDLSQANPFFCLLPHLLPTVQTKCLLVGCWTGLGHTPGVKVLRNLTQASLLLFLPPTSFPA